MKRCTRCGENKHLDEFQPDRRSPDGRLPSCHACKNAYRRERYHRSEAVREQSYLKHVKRKYALTPEAYALMLAEQDGRCGICHCDPAQAYSTHDARMQRLFVDTHRDNKRQVRGLLCHRCKHGLARYLDEPRLLEAAANYVFQSSITQ